MDICYELYQGLFSEVRALQGATVSCMRTMGRKFRTLHLQVGHYVLKQGDQVEHLFVIGRGAMEVIKDGELVTLLGELSIFRESLLVGQGTFNRGMRCFRWWAGIFKLVWPSSSHH